MTLTVTASENVTLRIVRCPFCSKATDVACPPGTLVEVCCRICKRRVQGKV